MHSFANIVNCARKCVTWLAAADASIALKTSIQLSDFHKIVSTTITNMIASVKLDGWSLFHESYTRAEGRLPEDCKSLLVDAIRCVHCPVYCLHSICVILSARVCFLHMEWNNGGYRHSGDVKPTRAISPKWLARGSARPLSACIRT